MKTLFLMVAVAFVLIQCGSESTDQDTETAHPDGSFEDGVYHCCAPGEGTACCDGYEQGMCFKFGGIYEQCIEAGETVSGKVICALCCDGLAEVSDLIVSEDPVAADPDGCAWNAPVDLLLCLPCGNGICDDKENRCNCPSDCGDTDTDAGADGKQRFGDVNYVHIEGIPTASHGD